MDFVAVDMPTANRMTVHMTAAFAEHEATIDFTAYSRRTGTSQTETHRKRITRESGR